MLFVAADARVIVSVFVLVFVGVVVILLQLQPQPSQSSLFDSRLFAGMTSPRRHTSKLVHPNRSCQFIIKDRSGEHVVNVDGKVSDIRIPPMSQQIK